MSQEDLMYASPEDIELFNKLTDGLASIGGLNGTGLDEDGVPIPYHCGPHSLRCFKEAIEICKPTNILEIGFNCGQSSAMWLGLSSATISSCDISSKKETLHGVKILSKKYEGRFSYCNRNDKSFRGNFCVPRFYSMLFVDGAHDYGSIMEDILLGHNLKIPWIVCDDWLPQFGSTQDVVQELKSSNLIELINVNGNIAILKTINT